MAPRKTGDSPQIRTLAARFRGRAPTRDDDEPAYPPPDAFFRDRIRVRRGGRRHRGDGRAEPGRRAGLSGGGRRAGHAVRPGAVLRPVILALVALLSATACQPAPAATETTADAPAAMQRAAEPAGLHQAIFAGGCFWGIEGVFSHVAGVTSAVSGYHGGDATTAQYERVSDGDTGHAEAVLVTYDSARVRYDQLLQVFFAVGADPTELNRQGPDVGSQYRSALVPMNDEQRRVATAYLAQLARAHVWNKPIVTRIEPLKRFYPAEKYHQDFMLRNPSHPYIAYWDAPKLEALRQRFPGLWSATFARN
ncbi:MAG: peptide-methionine (S)-S-oxide reductase MsrA [Sphingomonadales bacterium]|nr:peptide-methionine (S)-S-oxide reductase MsrA [Sphingomonadales bacterium]